MICAGFLAGAHLESGNHKILLFLLLRLFGSLPAEQKREFLRQMTEAASVHFGTSPFSQETVAMPIVRLTIRTRSPSRSEEKPVGQ